MNTKIGAMRADFGADTSNWDKGVAKVERDLGSLGKRFTALQTDVMAFGRKWVAPVVAVGAAMAGAARSAMEFADDLSTAADQVGISVERYQSLREAFRALEVDGDKFNQAMKRLEGTLGDLQNGVETEATKALDGMGVSARVLSGEITTTDGLLDAIADSATKAGSQAQFTSQMIDILGRKLGVDMAAALRDGGQGLHELERNFRDAGHVVDEAYIQKLADANESLDAFVASQKNDWVIWSAAAIDALSAVDEWLDRVEAGIQKKLGIDVGGAIGRVEARDRAAQTQSAKDMAAMAMRLAIPGYDPDEKERPIIRPRASKSKGGRAASGPSGPTDADRLENYFSALAELQGQRLSLESQITTDARERARLEMEQLAAERESYFADLDRRVKDKQISADAGKELKQLYDQEVEWRKRALVHRRLDAELAQDDYEAKRQSITQEIDMLALQSGLAQTTAERRDVALRLLELQYELERAALDEVINSRDASDAAKARAQKAKDALGGQYDVARQGVERDNMGPLAQYLDSLPLSAAKAQEALEDLQVEGIRGIVDGLADAAMGARSLGDVFSSVSRQIVADLLRIQIQKTLFGGGGSGGGIGGLFSSIGKLFGGGGGFDASGLSFGESSLSSSGATFPGFANGGSFKVGGNPGIDRNVLSINNIPAARVGMGEIITVQPNNDTGSSRGGNTVIINANDAVLASTVRQWVAEGMQQAAGQGSVGAQVAMAKQRSRAIP